MQAASESRISLMPGTGQRLSGRLVVKGSEGEQEGNLEIEVNETLMKAGVLTIGSETFETNLHLEQSIHGFGMEIRAYGRRNGYMLLIPRVDGRVFHGFGTFGDGELRVAYAPVVVTSDVS